MDQGHRIGHLKRNWSRVESRKANKNRDQESLPTYYFLESFNALLLILMNLFVYATLHLFLPPPSIYPNVVFPRPWLAFYSIFLTKIIINSHLISHFFLSFHGCLSLSPKIHTLKIRAPNPLAVLFILLILRVSWPTYRLKPSLRPSYWTTRAKGYMLSTFPVRSTPPLPSRPILKLNCLQRYTSKTKMAYCMTDNWWRTNNWTTW